MLSISNKKKDIYNKKKERLSYMGVDRNIVADKEYLGRLQRVVGSKVELFQ